MGEFEESVQVCGQVLQLKPDSYEAFYARARAKKDMGQLQGALEDLKAALLHAPPSKEVRRLLNQAKEELEGTLPLPKPVSAASTSATPLTTLYSMGALGQNMTSKKLYGKDLTAYDDLDVDDLLTQLSPEELDILSREVDPDDNLLPPSQRCGYVCELEPTGPLDRKKLIEHINKEALETPDKPEFEPFVAGVVRGKKFIAPEVPRPPARQDEGVSYDLGDEYEQALSGATEEELVDLAAILGFHSMMNQEQYHASLLNKDKIGLGWDGITKAHQPKALPAEPPNMTDPEESITKVEDDDADTITLNWNNLCNVSDEQFTRLFKAIECNTRLEVLNLCNTGLHDRVAQGLVEALEKNSTLRVLNVETNLISASLVVQLLKAMLIHKSIEEFRGSNQRSQVLGNKAEMEITQIVEQNPTILRIGLHLEYNDARSRVATHLQRNLDRTRTSVSLNVRIKRSSAGVVLTQVTEEVSVESTVTMTLPATVTPPVDDN
nr:EOG090X093U [Lepidurus arcticus]